MYRATIKEAIEDIIRGRLAGQNQIELVELALQPVGGGLGIIITLTTPGGITLDECACYNRLFKGEIERVYPDLDFTLEVRSPGLDRNLHNQDDFRRILGKRVRLTLRGKEGATSCQAGVLQEVVDEGVRLRSDRGEVIMFAWDEIAKAKQEIRW